MRINKYILMSLIASTALISCGPKITVDSEDLNKGTVTYFIKDDNLVIQAYPKDNYLFTGWFLKHNDDIFRFARADNPCIIKIKNEVTYQARFEDKTTQAFVFTMVNQDHYEISHFYDTEVSNVIIPSSHHSFPVTVIRENTFYNAKNINTISIPSSIKDIGVDAFKDCTNIESLTIDYKLETCRAAFSGWTSTQSINLHPDCFRSETKTIWDWSLTKIGENEYTSPDCGSSLVHIKKIVK